MGGSLLPFLPVIARLDGKAFHSFTYGMKKPYDDIFAQMMQDTASFLVKRSNALISYTQSDEISLLFYSGTLEGDIYFGAKKFKIISVLASEASVYFNELCKERMPERARLRPLFDCRVFQLPTKCEAAMNFAWRWQDAYKNSVTMMAQSLFSHDELHKKNTKDKLQMISDKGLSWEEQVPHFKYGAFVRRTQYSKSFTPEEIESLPPQHDYFKNKELMAERNKYVRFSSSQPLPTKCLFGEDS